jgi:hypothetical protein
MDQVSHIALHVVQGSLVRATTLSITTVRIITRNATLSIMALDTVDTVMQLQSVVMLSIFRLNVVMLSTVAPFSQLTHGQTLAYRTSLGPSFQL